MDKLDEVGLLLMAGGIALLLAAQRHQGNEDIKKELHRMSQELKDGVKALTDNINGLKSNLADESAKIQAAIAVLQAQPQTDPDVTQAIADIAAANQTVTDMVGQVHSDSEALAAVGAATPAPTPVPTPAPDTPAG